MNTVCIIGYGYWGKILHRTLLNHPDFYVKSICDRHSENKDKAILLQDGVAFLSDPTHAFSDESIDLIVIATQPQHHFSLCHSALIANKNVFVEKPMTLQADQAKTLYDLAQTKNKKIWVDHTFLFTGTYDAIRNIINNNAIGDIKRWHSTRSIVGAFSKPVDVIWDLLVHDLYILIDLFGIPIAINPMITANTMHTDCRDTLIAGFVFSNGLHATIHCDRLFHCKKREIIISGTTGTIVWDEMNDNKIQLFDYEKQPDTITASFVSHYEQPEIVEYKKEDALLVEMSALSTFLSAEKPLFFPNRDIGTFIIELLEKISTENVHE